jgi:hypothetical protein
MLHVWVLGGQTPSGSFCHDLVLFRVFSSKSQLEWMIVFISFYTGRAWQRGAGPGLGKVFNRAMKLHTT